MQRQGRRPARRRAYCAPFGRWQARKSQRGDGLGYDWPRSDGARFPGAIAQLGEHLHGMQKVRGSSPRRSTTFGGLVTPTALNGNVALGREVMNVRSHVGRRRMCAVMAVATLAFPAAAAPRTGTWHQQGRAAEVVRTRTSTGLDGHHGGRRRRHDPRLRWHLPETLNIRAPARTAEDQGRQSREGKGPAPASGFTDSSRRWSKSECRRHAFHRVHA